MKVRNLNGAIRKSEGKILIKQTAPDGRIIVFPVARSDAVKAVTEAYHEGGLHETNLAIGEDGALILEGTPPAPQADPLDDDEDLLADDNIDLIHGDEEDEDDLLADDDNLLSNDVEDLLAD